MPDELTDYDELRKKPSKFISQILGVDPFKYQTEFMDDPSRRKAFVSGRQVGKSRTAAWIGLHRAVTHADETVLITADAQRQAGELFAQIQSEMSNAGMSNDQWGVDRDTQTIIEFDNGSRILCLPTGRNGNKIRGYTADMVIVDEAAFVEDEIIEDVIEPMLFVNDGHLVLTSTPWGTSGYFYKNATKWSTDPDAYSTWDKETGGISSGQNPLISDDEVEQYKEGKTEMQIKQEVLGNFIDAAETFFPPELIRECMVTSVERETDAVYLGADLADAGDDETVLVLVDGNGNVFDIESHDISVTKSRKRIETLDAHYDFESIVVDETGIGAGPVQMLERTIGRKVGSEKLTTQKKQSMYQTLKAEMESGNVRFEHDEKMRTQLEEIVPNRTKNGNLSLHARTGHDDHPDALSLAVWALPDTTGSSRRTGAEGATTSRTLGNLRDVSNRKRQRGGRSGRGRRSTETTATRDDDLRRHTVSTSGIPDRPARDR